MTLPRWTGLLLLVGLLCLGIGVLFRLSNSIVVVSIIYVGGAAFAAGSLLLVALIGRWDPRKRR